MSRCVVSGHAGNQRVLDRVILVNIMKVILNSTMHRIVLNNIQVHN